MAVIATFGLRGHEVWHIDRLPGEVEADAGVIEMKPRRGIALPSPSLWSGCSATA
ncbi:MAG: hypothetical protein NTY67_11165 [Cyanobacteria bacterium]|nr:hypothetical protein [Cyanobacteriota bacterium]